MGKLQEVIQLDLQYSAWATRSLLTVCAGLSAEQQRLDLGVSHGSVLKTLHHVYVAERFWTGCLLADRIPPLDGFVKQLAAPELPFDELAQSWPKIWVEIDRWLATASDEFLSQTILLTISLESRFDCPRWQILRHIVNHATLHRGQILLMLRKMGKKPPCVDYLEYQLRERNLL